MAKGLGRAWSREGGRIGLYFAINGFYKYVFIQFCTQMVAMFMEVIYTELHCFINLVIIIQTLLYFLYFRATFYEENPENWRKNDYEENLENWSKKWT